MEKQMQIIKLFIEPTSNAIFDHYDYTYYENDLVISDKEVLQEYWGAWDDEELTIESIGSDGKFIVGRDTEQECYCQVSRRFEKVTPPHFAILKEYGVVA
jgi:hypothetical protein